MSSLRRFNFAVIFAVPAWAYTAILIIGYLRGEYVSIQSQVQMVNELSLICILTLIVFLPRFTRSIGSDDFSVSIIVTLTPLMSVAEHGRLRYYRHHLSKRLEDVFWNVWKPATIVMVAILGFGYVLSCSMKERLGVDMFMPSIVMMLLMTTVSISLVIQVIFTR